jgi:nucleotide-binding universal stress UspA family protein
MRVLLAIDGSASSEAARRLVESLNWPEGTIIEVIGVVEPMADDFATAGMALPVGRDSLRSIAARALESTLEAAAAGLEAPSRGVRPVLLEGRAATTIVDRATSLRAELVVIGSRGLGPLKSMLLGSVSAEVVDHAPCPVLVVRRPTVDSILLAVDGSVSSDAAVTFLAGSKFLAGRPIEVLSVGSTDSMTTLAPVASLSRPMMDGTGSIQRAHREQTEGVAARATETLLSDGCPAQWSVSEGNAAREIIGAARAFGSDLIVMGSRGRIGFTRMVLGSVARNVLFHTDSSVLIVHEPMRQRAAAPVSQPARRGTARIVELAQP